MSPRPGPASYTLLVSKDSPLTDALMPGERQTEGLWMFQMNLK